MDGNPQEIVFGNVGDAREHPDKQRATHESPVHVSQRILSWEMETIPDFPFDIAYRGENQGLKKGVGEGKKRRSRSVFFSRLRLQVLYVPLARLGLYLFELQGIFWDGFITNIVTDVLAFSFLFRAVCRIEGNCIKWNEGINDYL